MIDFKNRKTIIICIVAGLMLIGLIMKALGLAEPTCTERGEAYYKAIGSYPTLSDGRKADHVISEMCANNLDAFPQSK